MERIKQWYDRRSHKILIAIFVLALVIRLKYAFINGMWVDEGRFSLIATSLLEHPLDYSSPYHGTITEYPPVFPYLLFLSQLILGYGKTAVYVVSPIMAALTVVVTFYIGKEMFGDEEGLTGAFLLAVSPVFFLMSLRVLIGVTLTFMFALAIFLMYYGLSDREKSKYALWALGPVLAIAALTKQPAYILAPIFVIYLLYKRRLDFLRNPMDHKDLYIAVVFGFVAMLPWFLRSIMVCGLPMCSLSKVIQHITNESVRETISSGPPWYYLKNLGAVVGLPVAVVMYLRYTAGTVIEGLMFRDARQAVLGFGLWGLSLVMTLFSAFMSMSFLAKFAPLVFLLGIVAFQDSDGDVLLWIWIALGVGGLSTGKIKVPRYIIFTIPAFTLLVGRTLMEASDFTLEQVELDRRQVLAGVVLLVLVMGVFSWQDSKQRAIGMSQGFQELEPAGKWFRGKDVTGLASSPRQLIFYSGNDAVFEKSTDNATETLRRLQRGDYDYLVVDMYERTKIQGSVGLMVYAMQTQGQGLLKLVKSFGKQRVPCNQLPLQCPEGRNAVQLPKVAIYEVRRTA
jgi:4-amino-4-deoxy-L-arabinose transferase-like glycosyltransferase